MTVDATGWNYSLDELLIEQNVLKLRGWMTSPHPMSEIVGVQTIISGNQPLPEVVKFGIRSPDVEKAVGAAGANARFAADHVLPEHLSLQTFTAAYLKVTLQDGTYVNLHFNRDMESSAGSPNMSELRKLRVGIGITTYNRRDLIQDTLDRIEETTSLDVEIVIANDGSTDDTAEYLATRHGITVINAPNRGIAWNKNRALFYLNAVRKCDVIILIEDDVRPNRVGWDAEWVLAACSFGHVNYSPPWFLGHFGGTGRWHKPYRSGIVSGQCSAFTSEAMSYVGYLDTRFGKYGHEHVEHTLRMIRAGYGGAQLSPGSRNSYFLLMNGGIGLFDSVSSRDENSLRENAAVFESIWDESIYRHAWRNDVEMTLLRDEMLSAQRSVF